MSRQSGWQSCSVFGTSRARISARRLSPLSKQTSGACLNLARIQYSSVPPLYDHSDTRSTQLRGRAVAQAVSRCLPTAATRVRVQAGMWVLWWTKRHWGRFSPRVSPATHHSNNSSIIIITRGWHNRPIGGRRAEWTQLDSTPNYTNF
jgi:hypothetical protein